MSYGYSYNFFTLPLWLLFHVDTHLLALQDFLDYLSSLSYLQHFEWLSIDLAGLAVVPLALLSGGTAPEDAVDTCLATSLKASTKSDFSFGWFPPALVNIDVLRNSVLPETTYYHLVHRCNTAMGCIAAHVVLWVHLQLLVFIFMILFVLLVSNCFNIFIRLTFTVILWSLIHSQCCSP